MTTIERIQQIAESTYYTSDILGEISKEFPLEKIVVSYGKTRHTVYYASDGTLVAAKTTNGKRGGFVLCNESRSFAIPGPNGATYAVDPCMNIVHAEAARAIVVAFSCGNPATALTKLGQDADRCVICGACLIDQLSCSRGIGPECWKKIGVKELYGKWLASA